MTDKTDTSSAPKSDVTPLARRLREVGFIVDDACLEPTPERLGHVHLHAGDACVKTYCTACVKPLYILSEVIPNEPECEHESEVDANDLCLVCANCGIVYDNNLMRDDGGVLCHLVVENANLIDALRVFDGVPAEGREHVAIARSLDRQEALLKQGLASIAQLRSKLASGELLAKPAKKKSRGALSLVAADSPFNDQDPKPPAA